MKILITGGLGFIGHNVTAKLEQQGHTVSIIDTRTTYGLIPQAELNYLITERRKKIKTDRIYSMNISDQSSIDWVMRTHSPDVVIHLASFPRQKVVNANPPLGSQTMSEGLLNLLEAAKTHSVKRFVYISSSMVYGDFDDDVKEDADCRPQGQYGIMKLAGEWLVKDYSRRGFFDHVIIRPSAVYGELDVEDRVVSQFLLTAMRGGQLKVNGAGEALDFTHVDDTANGIVGATLSSQTSNRTYNITRGCAYNLLSAAKLAVQIAGQGSVEIRDKDADFPRRGALNIDAARRDFNYNPQINVEQGFQSYFQWLSGSYYCKKEMH